MTMTMTRAARALAWIDKPKHLYFTFGVFCATVFVFFLPTIISGGAEGDLPLYRKWAVYGWTYDQWVGRDFSWVYPQGAVLPISIAGAFGVKGFFTAWLAMTLILNLIAIIVISNRGRSLKGLRAAWFWLAVLFVLSPVSLLRLEGITAPLAIIALAIILRRPIIASVLLAVAAWIKVWPAAIFLAIIGSGVRRKVAVWTAVVFSVAFIIVVWASGGITRILDFLTVQGGRNLQLEAVVASPWLWLSVEHVPGFEIYDNLSLATRELIGPGSAIVARLMTPLMVLMALTLVVVMWRITRTRPTASFDVFLVGSLAIVLTMIVFNSVGSPQYMLWVAPVIAVGYAHKPAEWDRAARLFIGISILTSLIFPVFYMPLVNYSHFAALLLITRNVLVVVLFGWAVMRLLRTSKPADQIGWTPFTAPIPVQVSR